MEFLSSFTYQQQQLEFQFDWWQGKHWKCSEITIKNIKLEQLKNKCKQFEDDTKCSFRRKKNLVVKDQAKFKK